MPRCRIYDVIIVGAGPAGSLVGYLLSRRGLKVLIVEKKKLPRYKPCAGGLTTRALNILPFDVSDVTEDGLYTAKVSIQNRIVFTKTEDNPIVVTVMRDQFDYFLVRKAMSTGACLLDGVAFRSLSGSIGSLTVETSMGMFQTQLLVGADGVNSRVARKLGWRVRRNVMTAIEGEVFYGNARTVANLRGSAHFDFGVIPKGYGWVFPKSDHLSIGVLSTSSRIKDLKPRFSSYMKTKRLDECAEVRSLRTHLIPFGPDKTDIFADQRGMLVGDAAGFADPITGEGIFFALKEAQIASKAILDGLTLGHEYIEKYNDLLKKEFMDELSCGRKLSYILYKFPCVGHSILKSRGRILGEYYLDIVSGRRSYRELYNNMFRPSSILKFMFDRS